MATAKHTPGPWIGNLHHTQKYGPRQYAHIYSASKVHVASAIVQSDTFVDEAGRANVRLISAAPDFHEAATLAMNGRQVSATEMAISKGAWTALRDALAKANPHD